MPRPLILVCWPTSVSSRWLKLSRGVTGLMDYVSAPGRSAVDKTLEAAADIAPSGMYMNPSYPHKLRCLSYSAPPSLLSLALRSRTWLTGPRHLQVHPWSRRKSVRSLQARVFRLRMPPFSLALTPFPAIFSASQPHHCYPTQLAQLARRCEGYRSRCHLRPQRRH